jgi:hypothetical protein
LPHEPQWLTSVATSTQALLQLMVVAGQVAAQAPAEQTGAGAAQAWAHAPQFAGSLLMLAQVVPHTMLGAAQAPTQCPDTQVALAPHAVPHPPQFEGSVATSTHAPPQPIAVPGQVATQLPAAQLGVAPPQAWPHDPQFLGSLDTVAHTPEQLVCAVAHAPPSGCLDVVLLLQLPALSAMSANNATEVTWLRCMRTS